MNNWPKPLPASLRDLAPIMRDTAEYLRDHPRCANAMFAVAAVCGVASPLYLATRDLISEALGEPFLAWAYNTPRDEQIAYFAKYGDENVHS